MVKICRRSGPRSVVGAPGTPTTTRGSSASRAAECSKPLDTSAEPPKGPVTMGLLEERAICQLA